SFARLSLQLDTSPIPTARKDTPRPKLNTNCGSRGTLTGKHTQARYGLPSLAPIRATSPVALVRERQLQQSSAKPGITGQPNSQERLRNHFSRDAHDNPPKIASKGEMMRTNLLKISESSGTARDDTSVSDGSLTKARPARLSSAAPRPSQ